MATKTKNPTEVVIPALNRTQAQVKLVGDEPLISHAWSQKAKQEMLDKQMKKAKKAKEAKDPFMDFCHSMYWLDGIPEKPTEAKVAKARFGFPTIAFKAAAIGAGRFIKDLPMTFIKGMFFVPGELVEIECAEGPTMREDMVRIGMGTADIRYRGQFHNWSVTLPIEFNEDICSLEQIINLLNVGGMCQGVGEWRPEKGGQFGRFHVAAE